MNTWPFASALCIGLAFAGAPARAQIGADDAGSTTQTAGVLHAGVNVGYSDYLLPRRSDVDVWALPTQMGRIYRITSGPIDPPWEVFAIDPSLYQPLTAENGLVSLGHLSQPRWLSGAGGTEHLTILGAANANGEPRRYQVVVDAFDDPGDPEPDDPANAITLSDGQWYCGTLTPDRRLVDRIEPDVDCFRFACANGGLYRVEYATTSGAAPGVYSMSILAGQVRGVPVSGDHPVSTSCLVSLNNGLYKAVGDCTLRVDLRWNTRYEPSHFYRVRVTHVGSVQPDDHGDTSDRATVLRPTPLRAASVDGAIGNPAVSAYISPETRGDIDWFAVDLPPGHAGEVTIVRAGLYPYGPQDLSSTSSYGLKIIGERGQWGDLGSCEAALWPTFPDSTTPVKSMRFRARDNGRPVRFALTGAVGTYRVIATDLGQVNDNVGDPLTRGGATLRAGESVAGTLGYPTDIDSVFVERPAAAGIYALRVRYTVPNMPNTVIYPGFSLVRSAGPDQYSRSTQFHVEDSTVFLTSLGGAGPDSFPARLDLLNKRYPQGSFPATGPAHSYLVTLAYQGPLTTSTRVGPGADDEAPATLQNAPSVQVGVPFQARRHLGGDLADVFGVQLVAGRTYRYPLGHYSAALSIIDPSGNDINDGDATSIPGGPDDVFERRFVAPVTGIYGLRVSYRPTEDFTASTTCTIFDDGVSGDTPASDGPAKLRAGQTTGTIDYPGDRDRFELPWEPGTAFRLRVTGGADVSVLRGTYYTYQPVAGEPEFYFYIPYGLPRNPEVVTLRGTTAGQQYTLTLDAIATFHLGDCAQPGSLGATVIGPGDRTTLLAIAPMEPVRFGIRVEANHWYQLSLTSRVLNQPLPSSSYWATFTDDRGVILFRWAMGDPFFAERGGVIWVQPDYPPSWPMGIEALELGPGADASGPDFSSPATVRMGEVIEATIDRPGDIDWWATQGLETSGYALVFLSTSGEELARHSWNLSGDQLGGSISDANLPPGAQFPFVYRVSIVGQPVTPPPPVAPLCTGDFASTGGVFGRDGLRDLNDLTYFISAYFANSRQADIASAGGAVGGDGWLDSNDFVVMLDLIFTPCP